jgi:PadR family transcriptional regulator PadR
VEALLSARATLLLALLDGPGYRTDLDRRLHARTRGRVRLNPGNAYPALRRLERDGLLRSWKGQPLRQRGGRGRTYYELTPRGVTAAQETRAALGRLVEPTGPPKGNRNARVQAERLRRCDEVSALVGSLRQRA